VVAPALDTPAFSAAAMQQSDASGAVVLQLEDPQRKRRVAIVFGMVAFAALILIAAGIRHATSGAQTTTTAASAKASATASTQKAPSATAMATTAPTITPVPTVATASNPPPQSASTVGAPDPFDESTLQKNATPKNNNASTPHDGATHPTPPAKPAHKKPPHSSYEPEGI
jgi:cytoskeletal protein RodZ